MYAPHTTNTPWAMLMMRMVPNVRVNPLVISAYRPPVNTPRMIAWIKRCTGYRPPPLDYGQTGFGMTGACSAMFGG